MLKVSDLICKKIKNFGINTVFTLPGGMSMHLLDSFARYKFTIIGNLHEQSCGFGADGFAQYHNSLGVALVTIGPGSTNIITACASSWADSIPVLIISGTSKINDLIGDRKIRKSAPQEVDILKIVEPITKKIY